MPEERRGLSSRAALDGGMGTGESLSAPQSVQRLQRALHAKAKESPGFRFYSLCDKVWRDDVLAVAWREVRRNGGAAGVDGQTVADIEAYGVDRWLGESDQLQIEPMAAARSDGPIPSSCSHVRSPSWSIAHSPPRSTPTERGRMSSRESTSTC